MALRRKISESPAPDLYSENLYSATPEPTERRNRLMAHPSVSPNGTSDKENQTSHTAAEKGKGRAISVARTSSGSLAPGKLGKRRRLEAQEPPQAPGPRRRRTIEIQELDDASNSEGYDPDQDVHERRKLRNGLRELTKTLNDNRAEFLNPDSNGIIETLTKANNFAESVKQTADATIDSRLLVTTADLSYRKTVQLTLGDSAQGVDVDEFVSKCISLMRRAENASVREHVAALSSTQRQRQRTQNVAVGSDDEQGDEGDMMNWEALGRIALQHNTRPAVPGFLLGPLSAQKRARKVVERKARLNIKNLKETQPTILDANDIQKSDNTNLTVLCARIHEQLSKTIDEGQAAVEAEAEEGMTEGDIRQLMYKHGVLSTGGVDFFQFVINPHSFGQTVENMFYVSFLIRDGKVGVEFDDDNLPSLSITTPRNRNDVKGAGVAKHQAILSLDMASWKEIIEVFNIKTPIIPHREEDEVRNNLGARGWFS